MSQPRPLPHPLPHPFAFRHIYLDSIDDVTGSSRKLATGHRWCYSIQVSKSTVGQFTKVTPLQFTRRRETLAIPMAGVILATTPDQS